MGAKKPTAVTVVAQNEPSRDINIETMITLGIEKGMSVETMERLFAMRRELKAEFAKEEFDKAMANFQMECPVIKKKKAGGRTKGGQVAYHYAPLDTIVEQTKGPMNKNGFSYKFDTVTTDTGVKVTCVAKHSAGHSEPSEIEVPLGTRTDIMSAPQVTASAITFAKRYAFCNAFGILTGDEDNDALTVPPAETPTDRIFATTKQFAAKASIEQLEDYKDKLLLSNKYSPAQKEELLKIINERINEIVPA